MEGELIKQKEICKWCGKEFVTLGERRGGKRSQKASRKSDSKGRARMPGMRYEVPAAERGSNLLRQVQIYRVGKEKQANGRKKKHEVTVWQKE